MPLQKSIKRKISETERERLKELLKIEKKARLEGFKALAGIDEAGRGALAGPVVAAACVIPDKLFFAYVNDSKQLTSVKRSLLFEQITKDKRVLYGIGIISSQEIDRINIYQATIAAMLQAVEQLEPSPDLLLVDGMPLFHPAIPHRKIIGGDALVHGIAAASILAKVTRDRLMIAYHQEWPQYGFDRHKGYGTEDHLEALKKYGPCPKHRLTFAPLKLNTYEK